MTDSVKNISCAGKEEDLHARNAAAMGGTVSAGPSSHMLLCSPTTASLSLHLASHQELPYMELNTQSQ